jgi:cobalt-zinc-cadmium efflux system outer membrane protein
MATSCHPALREAGARVQAAHGNWVQVGLKPNPEIGYSGTEIGDEGRAGQQGGFVSQEIVTAGKLGLNRAVAARDQAVAEQRVALTRWQVITTVRKAYFETLAAERSVKLAHELNEIASQATSVSERRLKAMDVPKTSLLQSQIESDSAALLEQQASERLSAARRRLATALGTPDQPPATLEDVFSRPLPALDYESVRGQLIENSPELAALHFAVDRARMAVERESAGKSPNVNVSAGVQHDYATQDTIANVQLSLPIPFYDRNQGAIARACGELAAAQAALEARQLAVQERLALAMRDYATARERVTKYNEKILPAAKETLDLINAGYTGGQLEYVQVYNVQQIYANKNLAYLQDLEVAWQRWAEIDGFLVGDVSADSIDRSAQTTENTGERRY